MKEIVNALFGFAKQNKLPLGFIIAGELLKVIGSEIFKERMNEKQADQESESTEVVTAEEATV